MPPFGSAVTAMPEDKPHSSETEYCTSVVGAGVLYALGLTADNMTVMSLDKKTYALLSEHALRLRGGASGVDSLCVEATQGGDDDSDDCEEEDTPDEEQAALKHTAVGLGKGVHAFTHNGETVWVVQQTAGAPVGTNCGADLYSSKLFIARGSGRGVMLQALCNKLVERSERHHANSFRMYQWNVEHGYWKNAGVRTARPIESVVLPEEQRARTVADMDDFLSDKTRRFYAQHGIPYKRAYLFWGVPGTGKTSLIQALAGKYKRSVCFMQPTDPKFTDDMLRNAVTYVPARSVIVFEDIDALFTKDRTNRGKSAVTFSGLLNALDGVGMKEGQIFVLTTNFREQLDAALIRNGRVDVHVEFQHIQEGQCCEMFRRFFPADAALATDFFAAVKTQLGENSKALTPAALQHFFIQQFNHKHSGAEAIKHVDELAQELTRRDSEEKEKPKEKSSDDKDESDEEGEEKKKKATDDATPAAYHWHLSVSPAVALMVVAALTLPVIARRRL